MARSGRGDSGEVQKYILSKVAVSCEGEQTAKKRQGIPPPDLSRPPWDNPTSFESRGRLGSNPSPRGVGHVPAAGTKSCDKRDGAAHFGHYFDRRCRIGVVIFNPGLYGMC